MKVARLLATLFFIGCVFQTQSGYGQNKNSNGVVRKHVKSLQKGKAQDSLTALTTLTGALPHKKLKPKWRKRGIATIKKAYPIAVNSSKAQVAQHKGQIAEAANDYLTQYKLYNSIVQNLKKRKTLADKLNEVSKLFPKLLIENIGELQTAIDNNLVLLESARNKAAELLYNKANTTLSRSASTKQEYQAAYYDLRQCLSLIPNYKDAVSLQRKAQELGTVKIKILPIKNGGGRYSHKVSSKLRQQLQKQIELNHKKTPFIAISTNMASPDYTVTIMLEEVSIIQNVLKPIKKNEIKTIERRESEDDVQVRCTATLYQKEKTCSIPGMYVIRDKHGNQVATNSLLVFYRFDHSYVTVSGDRRALSKRMKRHARNDKDRAFPTDDNIISRAFFKFEASLEHLFNKLHSYAKL